MNLSEKIKKIRADNNLTQELLAEKLQVSRSTISSWETGRSYPDLEMVVEICDRFNVSLDFLLREDEKMVRKLNFGIKQKRLLTVLVIILVVLLVNTFVSKIPFKANPNSLEISNVKMVRDLSYNGGDPNRDWNTTINLTVKSKNLFFKPIGDDMLVFNKNGNLSLQTNWTFSILNIFDIHRFDKADQSVLIDENVSNEDITLKLHEGKSNKLISFEIYNINN
ncbi:helix-turn-helix domain-containing protein [Metabacillus halosaccharovorans]|uniref:helix-turn-helix domain-containing protein n=1 Tax=Metabacillus halosaccharovorans TaxID=930124 RepID=UPI001C1F4F6A|nr:helix-turn-helix transcriptional regulator [Metabacillus halosaccharovorans]MBU7592848.1 helix-turn-helix transcriptional regulator [Metabacillus halosaccharovorans]